VLLEEAFDDGVDFGGGDARLDHFANQPMRLRHKAASLAHQLDFPRTLERNHANPLPLLPAVSSGRAIRPDPITTPAALHNFA
jgi:hypothetical protein